MDPKHWVLTRCGKIVVVKNHAVRDFSWELADSDNPIVQERCRLFGIDPTQFNLNHPKIEQVDDAIAQQISYFYWTEPNDISYAILNVAANDANILLLKSSEIDLLIGDDNWTLVAKEHPANISFGKRLDMFASQSEKIKDTLYFLGEDNGWLLLYSMKANLFSESICVKGMVFHSDPMLQLNSQQSWERHGNKKLYLAFCRKGTAPHLQDSIWVNVGWPNSPQCLRSHIKISAKLVNDNRIKH
jgi:hypothetical protein